MFDASGGGGAGDRAARHAPLPRRRCDGARQARFKLYHLGRPVALSDVLPLLENMGVRVGSEIPHEVRPSSAPERGSGSTTSSSSCAAARGRVLPPGRDLPGGVRAGLVGDVENDGFNRLVVRAGLAWYEVVVLRAYAKFLRQARSAFSQSYMQETLADSPEMARLLVELFTAALRSRTSAGGRRGGGDARDAGAGCRRRCRRSRAWTRTGSSGGS